MIQAVMLIALGFFLACLLGAIVAPALWTRAYRLAKKRLERTLPFSLSEIEAAQDQLRASYAVKLRRLETALSNTKQKAALQLVDNSRLQMQIAALRETIADLEMKLAERRNAASVLEHTITKRFPDLEREMLSLRSELTARSNELRDLTTRLARKDESLESAKRTAAAAQEELAKLKQALEKSSADKSGRRLRRPSQWSLDDYRSEYDRLNLELSRLRQQLTQYQDRETQQAGLIRGELQKLAEMIIVSAPAKGEARPAARIDTPVTRRAGGPNPARERPLPWPQAAAAKASSEKARDAASTSDPNSLSRLVAKLESIAFEDRKPDAGGEPAKMLARPQEAQAETEARKVEPPGTTVIEANGIAQVLRSMNLGADQPAAADGAVEAKDEVQDAAHGDDAPSPKDKADASGKGTGALNGSEKALSDARELRALSELINIAVGAAPDEPVAKKSEGAIAEEANSGLVIEGKAQEIEPRTAEGGTGGEQSQNRTLLDRLRSVSSEASGAKK